MFFSKIRGLWRDGNYIFISAEYHNIKFHINEIECVQIVTENGLIHTVEDLPIPNAIILFLLKSGRKKSYHMRKLTKRKYKYLLNILETK